MRTRKIYKIGIFVIIFICFTNPLSYLVLGERTIGKVEWIFTQNSGGRFRGISTYPFIGFQADSLKIIFRGEQNLDYQVGDSVKVLYYPFAPKKAKIFSFSGLFVRSFIELAFCLLVWYAFFSSFNTIFDEPIVVRRSNSFKYDNTEYSDLPKIIKLLFKGLLILMIIVLLIGVVSVFNIYFENNLKLETLLLLIISLGMMIFFMVIEFRKI